MMASTRRVVVTGMGLVTCLGIGTEHVWTKLLQSKCGIRHLKGKEFEGLTCRVGGLVPRGEVEGELDLMKWVSAAEQKTMSLATCYALVAAQQALTQAGWHPQSDHDCNRTGVAVGMGMPGLEEIVDAGITMRERGARRVSPYFVPSILVNMAAGHISLKHKLRGPNHAVSTACTTGLHAIGDAMRFIQHGDADVMVCGGTEASVAPLALAGFCRMRALSTGYNDSPELASRPFDGGRDGFVMGEGAGLIVLEELGHAESRGARVYGEVLGYGLSADAHHMTAPSESGEGAERCMRAALRDAHVQPEDVGHINAHATSTPLGDRAETLAISRLFPHRPAVTSTKGAVGHLLGAAGSVEAVLTVMAAHTAHLPPTLNCSQPDCNLNLVNSGPQPWTQTHRVALTNSFGFGGTNASVCISNYPHS